MKTIFRVSIAVAILGMFAFPGVAVPAEPISAWQAYYLGVPEPVPVPGTIEYVMAMETGILPSTPLAPFAVAKAGPEAGTWEYSQAMETGELPSACGDEPCAVEEFTIVEVGTLRYRLGIDDGGGGE